MITFLCNKLARDKTKERLQAQDVSISYKMVSGNDLRLALKNKLVEECAEVVDAKDRQELIAELADVLEVVDGLCKAYGIAIAEVEQVKVQKYNQRGGFEQGLFIDTIMMQEDNPNASHFRLTPDRYPEIEAAK